MKTPKIDRIYSEDIDIKINDSNKIIKTINEKDEQIEIDTNSNLSNSVNSKKNNKTPKKNNKLDDNNVKVKLTPRRGRPRKNPIENSESETKEKTNKRGRTLHNHNTDNNKENENDQQEMSNKRKRTNISETVTKKTKRSQKVTIKKEDLKNNSINEVIAYDDTENNLSTQEKENNKEVSITSSTIKRKRRSPNTKEKDKVIIKQENETPINTTKVRRSRKRKATSVDKMEETINEISSENVTKESPRQEIVISSTIYDKPSLSLLLNESDEKKKVPEISLSLNKRIKIKENNKDENYNNEKRSITVNEEDNNIINDININNTNI